MGKKSILRFINYRLVLVHLVASWFFMYAIFMLAHLLNPTGFYVFTGKGVSDYAQMDNVIEILLYSPYVGLVIALVVSLVICIKKEWPMMNAALVFLISFLLKRFDLTGWNTVKPIFRAAGNIFGYPHPLFFITNGVILLAIGIAVFFLKATNNFIAKGKPAL
jgi:hypothetical protein